MDNDKRERRAYSYDLDHRRIGFLNLLRPYSRSLFFGFMLLLLTNILMVTLPLLINAGVSLIDKDVPAVVDLIFVQFTIADFSIVLQFIVLFAIAAAVIRTISRIVIFDIGRGIERDVRRRLFFHISVVDDPFFTKKSVGDLMNHLTTDVSNIRLVTGFAALNLMNIILVFVFTVPLLLKIDVVLALVALLPFPLIVLATSQITKKMFLASIAYQQELSTLISHVQENLLGAHVVRLFHQQHQEARRFHKTNHTILSAGLTLGRARIVMLPIMRLIVGVSVLLVLYVGGRSIALGRIDVGDFVEINARLLQLTWPAMSVGFVLSVVSRGRASLDRLNDLLAYKPVIVDGTKQLQDINTIDVKDINLAGSSPFSFHAERGQFIGVVGPSGSYKTMLLRALCRRIPLPPRTIFFDNHDIEQLSLSSIYEQIGVVSEDNFIFHKSIVENISFLRPEATTEEIDEVVKLVRLDRDLLTFKDGLNTEVGERGITLSGGQRQRLALARVLLAKRPVIILDDALSSVDVDTERHIISRLLPFAKDSIVIMATQRLSILEKADHILVMERGQLSDEGTHQELMKSSQLYRALFGVHHAQRPLS